MCVTVRVRRLGDVYHAPLGIPFTNLGISKHALNIICDNIQALLSHFLVQVAAPLKGKPQGRRGLEGHHILEVARGAQESQRWCQCRVQGLEGGPSLCGICVRERGNMSTFIYSYGTIYTYKSI